MKDIKSSVDMLKKQEAYWISRFADEVPALELPTDYVRPAVIKLSGESYKFELSKEVTHQVRKLISTQDVSLSMALFAIYNILLSKYANTEDVVVGTGIVGMFENILAIRNQPARDKTFVNFLAEIKDNTIKGYANKDYKLEMLVEKLKIPKIMNRNPLVDVLFVVHNEVSEESGKSGLNNKTAQFDLVLHAFEIGEKIFFELEYSTSLFKNETIERMAGHYVNIIRAIVENIETRLSAIKMISDVEKEQLLDWFNETKVSNLMEKTISQLFEEQVHRTPDNLAVIFGEQQLTYRELNEKANQLARKLRTCGVAKGKIVGIMVERSLEMVIGILGILKADGAYLPIDYDYPIGRITYMFEDCQVEILLTQGHLTNIVQFSGDVINIEDERLYSGDCLNLECFNKPTDLAYVIYTSGSTGKPKGVMVEHKGIGNLQQFFIQDLGITEDDNVVQFASCAFDASVWEEYMALLTGATLDIPSKDIINNFSGFEEYLKQHKITIVTVAPIYLNNLNPENVITLRKVITAGSATNFELVNKWKDKVEYINAYGPTETTICASIYKCEGEINKYQTVPIGYPIMNTQIYILDKNNQLVPVGVPGELCVGGDGLARGYLNRPELTKEKFIANPFILGSRLYKTGDLARWLSDGNIEFLGRIDHQVKLRGYRIELGEIENKLLKHNAIKEAIVIVKVNQKGSKNLCAYLICECEVSIAELREHLAKELPDYMIPSYFIYLDEIPLTVNGKVDRKALPEPDGNINLGTEYVAPTNEIEMKLASFWREVLGLEKVGINDNFFELGGDSIKAIQILARLNQIGINITVKDIFRHKTIKNLLKNVNYTKEKEIISQKEVEGEVLLTPIQKWFVAQNLKYQHYFNQTFLFNLREDVNVELLETVFKNVIKHHDALRMRYQFGGSQILQYNRRNDEIDFRLKKIDLSKYLYSDQKEKIKVISEKIQGEFDLEKDLLIKAVIFDLGENGKRLLIPIHHLIIDGVSWRILLEDVENLYRSKLEKELSLKTTSFKDWSQRLNDFAQTEAVDTGYWNKIDVSKIKSLSEILSTDRFQRDYMGLAIEINEEQTEKLLTKVNWAYNTEIKDILLSALIISISEVMGIKNVLINLEGHGREEILEGVDLSRTIGWFTSMYPVYLEKRESIEETIIEVKESLSRVPNKGINFGIARYLKNDEKLQMMNPEILFNYLGEFAGFLDNDEKKNECLLSGCTEDAGMNFYKDNQNIHLIDLVGLIRDGKLQLTLNYNTKYFGKNIMTQLQVRYADYLNQIIEHCLNKSHKSYTASDFGLENVIDKKGFAYLSELFDLDKVKMYELTPMQEGMLYHKTLNEKGRNYYEQFCFEIEGTVDIEKFKVAWEVLVNRYEVFKTRFIWKSLSNPIQVIKKDAEAEIDEYDISNLSCIEKEEYIERFKDEDLVKDFDFEKGKLNRFSLIKVSEGKYFICWSFHHILLDGWSHTIVMEDLFSIYYCLANNLSLPSEPAVQFSVYLEWLRSQNKNKAFQFWASYTKDFVEPTLCPYDKKPMKNEVITKSATKVIEFDEQKAQEMNEFCKKHNVTINAFIQTVTGLLLQKYNSTNQSCFGMTVSGRPTELRNVEEIVGILINTLPVVIKTEEDDTVEKLLVRVNRELIEIRDFEYISLAEIQKLSQHSGELFNTIIVFENYPTENENDLDFEVRVKSLFEITNYDFSISVMSAEKMVINLAYNVELFKRDTIERIKSSIIHIIDTMLADGKQKVQEICIVSKEEKERLLVEFNNANNGDVKGKTIHELFEEQVKKRPDHIAVVFKDKELTYGELNLRANQLARVLREKGVQPKEIVAIMVERSLEMIVGFLGTLKAGGAYLSIDPEYPKGRIEYVLADSDASILLTQKHLADKANFAGTIIDLEDQGLYSGDESDLDNINKPTDLAYVIYTSGTTGRPKGVMIEHKGIENLQILYKKDLSVNENDRIIQFATCSFDAFVWETYMALLTGATLYILSKEVINDYARFEEYLNLSQITIATLPPIYLNSVNPENVHTMKTIITAGSATNFDLVDSWKEKVEYINAYGPTETTICATIWKAREGDYNSVPIGKPIFNTRVYIVDQNLNLVPIGAVGELCITTVGIAKGYMNRPELTEEKFVKNPFVTLAETKILGEKMYKTGDLARWLPDGNIEFLGRIDNQVKIRGFRIELGEIENQLLAHKEVKEAVVIDKVDSSGNKYLCAYVVSGQDLSTSELRTHLLKEVPEYMIPSYFVRLEQLPLTLNGKVNKKLLPELDQNLVDKVEYEAPRNEIEENLVRIWKSVLNVERIGIKDNFFNLGGHSILAMKVVAIAVPFGWNITVQALFNYPTIKKLADKINGNLKIESKAKSTDVGAIVIQEVIKSYQEIAISGDTLEIENVLLTGATGFLGIHILEELLLNTDANIYCLVRGEDENRAKTRLLGLMDIYFDGKYDQWMDKRIYVVRGELTFSQFGLSEEEYISLGAKIDSILHPAAIVKHFGNYSDFEKVNVLGTKEVIDFAIKYGVRLNHISTMSVSGTAVKGEQDVVFTENDFYVGQNYADNVYVKSKFEAENLVFKAMNEGLDATIFRVGNLTGRYRDGHFQTNIGENAFYNLIKSIVELKSVSAEMIEQPFEFTPIDLCSRVIVELMKTKESVGRVFHVYNQNQVKLAELLPVLAKMGLEIDVIDELSIDEYVRTFAKDQDKLEKLQGLMHLYQLKVDPSSEYRSGVTIDSTITVEYLRQIGFEWPGIDQEYLVKVVEYMMEVEFV